MYQCVVLKTKPLKSYSASKHKPKAMPVFAPKHTKVGKGRCIAGVNSIPYVYMKRLPVAEQYLSVVGKIVDISMGGQKIERFPFTIGRGVTSDFVLETAYLPNGLPANSRNHAEIDIGRSGRIIINDHSSNGTIIINKNRKKKVHNDSADLINNNSIIFSAGKPFKFKIKPHKKKMMQDDVVIGSAIKQPPDHNIKPYTTDLDAGLSEKTHGSDEVNMSIETERTAERADENDYLEYADHIKAEQHKENTPNIKTSKKRKLLDGDSSADKPKKKNVLKEQKYNKVLNEINSDGFYDIPKVADEGADRSWMSSVNTKTLKYLALLSIVTIAGLVIYLQYNFG
jgi:hypothetical protein